MCSQKSYITSKLRDELELPTITTHDLMMKEFGTASGTLSKRDLVQVALKCSDNSIVKINAFVVNTSCSVVSQQAIDIAQRM